MSFKKDNEHPFSFPFPPYDIQVDLMTNMTRVMNEGKIGIMESPTGTGKTLSIICSALSWLKQYHEDNKTKMERELDVLVKELQSLEMDTSSNWITSHGRKKELQEEKVDLTKRLDVVKWKEKRDEELKERRILKLQSNNVILKTQKRKQNPTEDDIFDFDPKGNTDDNEEEDNDDKDVLEVKDGEEEPTVSPKVIYACRTHSQLSQFVNEVKKTRFGNDIRLVSLGSRGNLCTNPSVNNSNNVSLINDRCMDMMRCKKKSTKKKSPKEDDEQVGRCPYLTPKGVHELKEDILSKVQDIEEVASGGRQLNTCAYYASRRAVKEADVIVIPYNVLLHPKTRESYGITLNNSVIIIDEAHNLLETITSLHSSEVRSDQLTGCLNQLTSYMTRYGKRFNPKNLLLMKQLVFTLKSIVSFLNRHHFGNNSTSVKPSLSLPSSTTNSNGINHPASSSVHHPKREQAGKCDQQPHHLHNHSSSSSLSSNPLERVFTLTDFLVSSGIENINLFKLTDFLDKSQLARKLFGFSLLSSQSNNDALSAPVTSSMHEDNIAAVSSRVTSLSSSPGQSLQSNPNEKKKGGTTGLLSRIQEKKKLELQDKNKKRVIMNQTDVLTVKMTTNNLTDKVNKGIKREKSPVKVNQQHYNDKNRNANVKTSEGVSSSSLKNEGQGEEKRTIPSSPLYVIQELIKCLSNPAPDGRVILTRTSSSSGSDSSSQDLGETTGKDTLVLRYFLLNASDHFKDIVKESRSVILAGGTMKPFEEFTELLFKPMSIPRLEERIITFSCGHVIPSDNILPLALSYGPAKVIKTNTKDASVPPSRSSSSSSLSLSLSSSKACLTSLNYSFASRNTVSILDQTGRLLLDLCYLIPGGLVLFFPSYDYLDSIYSRWESTRILHHIQVKAGKKVFREPKNSSLVSRILTEYSRVNQGRSCAPSKSPVTMKETKDHSLDSSSTSSGGILLSVVGGKVSEGINFNDDMCRCVILVGMPYSNSQSASLKEKMSFFDRVLGPGNGRFYYENLCFKAINQSIGRSIRHKDDYSVILLLDERYSRREKQVKESLPKWIADQLQTGMSFEDASDKIRSFFKSKRLLVKK